MHSITLHICSYQIPVACHAFLRFWLAGFGFCKTYLGFTFLRKFVICIDCIAISGAAALVVVEEDLEL